MPPFETTLDLLFFTLSISVGCLTILLSIILIKVIKVLANFQKITETVKALVTLANDYAWKPLEILNKIKDQIIEQIEKHNESNKEAKPPKKKITKK